MTDVELAAHRVECPSCAWLERVHAAAKIGCVTCKARICGLVAGDGFCRDHLDAARSAYWWEQADKFSGQVARLTGGTE